MSAAPEVHRIHARFSWYKGEHGLLLAQEHQPGERLRWPGTANDREVVVLAPRGVSWAMRFRPGDNDPLPREQICIACAATDVCYALFTALEELGERRLMEPHLVPLVWRTTGGSMGMYGPRRVPYGGQRWQSPAPPPPPRAAHSWQGGAFQFEGVDFGDLNEMFEALRKAGFDPSSGQGFSATAYQILEQFMGRGRGRPPQNTGPRRPVYPPSASERSVLPPPIIGALYVLFGSQATPAQLRADTIRERLATLKREFGQQLLQHHPDRNGNSPASAKKTREVLEQRERVTQAAETLLGYVERVG